MGIVVVEIRTSAQEPRKVRRTGAVQIGRGPDNDVVLVDPQASWRHALVYLDGDELWVRDLGSRNGTWVDGEPIGNPVRLSRKSRIGIGQIEIGVDILPEARGPLLVEDMATGVRHPMCGERFVVGTDERAHLHHPGLVEALTVIDVGHGEVWIGHCGEDRPIELDVPFEVGGARFVVREATAERVPTVEAQGRPYAYVLEASLDTGPGPIATLRDPATGSACRFTAETRAVMLYTLGRQILEDRVISRTSSDEGWVPDLSLVTAVWGRTEEHEGRARLKTLVHRVRGDCRGTGLDPWCVEKRSGHTRLRVDAVHIPRI